jgi:hypothetical protein
VIVRARSCWLAAGLLLTGCKSEDKPRPAEAPTVESAKEQAAETVESAKDKAETAADKARSALDTVKEKAKEAGELARDRAVDAITDATVLRDMLSLVDDRIAKAADEITRAPTEQAREAAAAALAKLREEKLKIQARLSELKAP